MCGGWWESGVPRRWGVAEGHWGVVSSLPWCGFGVMADTGEMACLPELSATAALCGRRQLTAGFQTITLNICKQIKKKKRKKQTHWAQMETSAFLLSMLSPSSALLKGFPGGRSGCVLAPQVSPTHLLHHSTPMANSVCSQCARRSPSLGIQSLKQQSSRVPLKTMQLSRVLDSHIGRWVPSLGFKATLEPVRSVRSWVRTLSLPGDTFPQRTSHEQC